MYKFFLFFLFSNSVLGQINMFSAGNRNSFTAGTNTTSSSVFTSGNGLDFDGVNDYVDCGTNASLNIKSSMTIELWIKPNQDMGNGKWDRLVHKDWPTGYFFGGKAGANNALAVVLSGDLNAAVTPNNTVVVGVWQHIAFVFDDPANTIKIYKDGVVVSTTTWTGSISGNPNSILTLSQSSETFNGVMDDVRIWNVARTQTEIQTNMNKELTGTETGLVANYTFNQGIAGGNNSAINTITDKTANAISGTLTNFNKTGTFSNFVLGRDQTSIVDNGLVLNFDASNVASYSGSGTTWNDISGNNNNGTLINNPTFNNGSFLFNGSNYINIPHSASIAPSTGLITVSTWFKATATGSENSSIIYNKENEYELSAGGGYITYAFRPNWAWVGRTAFTINQWYQVTITYNQVYQKMYVNGVEVYSAAQTGAVGNNNSLDLRIGARGAPGAPGSLFVGSIPVLLIYNRALTAAEVLSNYNAQKSKFGL